MLLRTHAHTCSRVFTLSHMHANTHACKTQAGPERRHCLHADVGFTLIRTCRFAVRLADWTTPVDEVSILGLWHASCLYLPSHRRSGAQIADPATKPRGGAIRRQRDMSFAKPNELTADSKQGFNDAIRRGVDKASSTLEQVRSMGVVDQIIKIEKRGGRQRSSSDEGDIRVQVSWRGPRPGDAHYRKFRSGSSSVFYHSNCR